MGPVNPIRDLSLTSRQSSSLTSSSEEHTDWSFLHPNGHLINRKGCERERRQADVIICVEIRIYITCSLIQKLLGINSCYFKTDLHNFKFFHFLGLLATLSVANAHMLQSYLSGFRNGVICCLTQSGFEIMEERVRHTLRYF